VFGRRRREQEEAARDAERHALFAELAKRPDTICPFLGKADSRTGYQESVSEEHRCYAFGDPAELSAEQQQKVCLQPGYGNCPRYLRGVLVIPTEELEALRHPQPVPPRPAAAAAAAKAKSDRSGRGGFIASVVLVLLIVGVAGGGAYWYVRNQVPSSASIASLPAGTELSAELLSLSEPADGSQRVTAETAIEGAADVPDTTLVYAIDLSGSTLDGPGCGGDQNGDGRGDTPLDCEIAAATALNGQAVENGTVAQVGLVGFAGGATTADLAPGEGIQVLTAPEADVDGDGTPDVVDALQSAHSAGRRGQVGFRVFTEVTTTTETTAFSAGITAACQIMDESDTPNRLVVFLSDGDNEGGEPVSSVLPCDATAVFQTFAVGADAGCAQESELGGLQEVADLTEGLCTSVVDLTRLPEILESVVDPQIVRIQLTIDGGDPSDISHAAQPRPPEAGPARIEVDYPIGALTPGEHQICMTVFASDAGGAGSVETCSTVDASGGRLTSN
jgi:hypothetical protein